MSALAAAFQRAGFVTATDRLAKIVQVLVRNPPAVGAPIDWTDAAAAHRLRNAAMQAVKNNPRHWDGARDALFKLVRNDASLLWAMFAPYRAEAAQRLLTAAAAELREQEMPRERHGGAGHTRFDDQVGRARPASSRAGAAALRSVARRSLLDTFLINGMPIGDVTPTEAREWAKARARDARFVRALIANLPPNEPIRKWRTADEANAIYAEAENENV